MRVVVEWTRFLRPSRGIAQLCLSILLASLPSAVHGSQPQQGFYATVNDAPQILNFTVQKGTGNLWIIKGTIDDEDPGSCIIEFGGLLDGKWIEVDDDGTFSFTVQLPKGTSGGISAAAVDAEGAESLVVESFIF